MASSFIEFRGVGFWARGYSIEMWMYLLAQETSKLGGQPEWLLAAVKDWREQATAGMIGCISPELDKYATTAERVDVVLTLAHRALGTLRGRGAVLSAEWLNSLGLGGPGAHFDRDLPAEVFTRVGETFVLLLRGEITWDAHTSPVL